jgi:hypothetical protein
MRDLGWGKCEEATAESGESGGQSRCGGWASGLRGKLASVVPSEKKKKEKEETASNVLCCTVGGRRELPRKSVL